MEKPIASRKTNLGLLAILGTLNSENDLAILLLSSHNLGVERELDALLGKDLLEVLGDTTVDSLSSDSAKELDDLNLGSKTTPNGSHLESDNSSSNNDELLGDLLEVKDTGGGNNLLLVNLHSGERGNLGSGGDDDVLGRDLRVATVEESDVNLGGRGEGSLSLDVVDLVLLEEIFDTTGERRDGLVLGGKHDGEVELDITD